MSDIDEMVAWLTGVLDNEERAAKAATSGPWHVHDTHLERGGHTATVLSGEVGASELRSWLPTWRSDVYWDQERNVWNDAKHIARHDPAHVLNVVAAHRVIIAEVMSWQHFYLDEDARYSCSQAVDPSELAAEPGSGCLDDERAGKPCDCDLDRRRMAILGSVAAGHASRDGYRPEWGQR